MKKVFFTIGGGPKYANIIPWLQARFEKINGFPLTVIDEAAYKARGIRQPYWVKAFAWDIFPDADMIGWIDADLIPVAPLGEFKEGLSARIDAQDTFEAAKRIYKVPFTRGYFNVGLLVATRVTIPFFDEWKKIEKIHPDDSKLGWVEQSWMSVMLQRDDLVTFPVNVLPPGYNHLVGTPEPPDIRMRHYCGPGKKVFMRDWEKYRRE